MEDPPRLAAQLAAYAQDQGADRARPFEAEQIVIHERVRLKCLVPRCPSYGLNLMCPPGLPSVAWFRQVVSGYRWALLLQVLCPLGPSPWPERAAEVSAAAKKLHQVVNAVEKKALFWGWGLAAGFIGGSCRLCQTCVGQNSGRPCRLPGQARPSMEAMGIDALATAAAAGLPFQFPAREELVWNGLVLLD